MEKSEIVFLIVIGNKKEKENLINELGKIDAKLFNIIYGHGTVRGNELLKAFGLVVEQSKVIITCLLKKEKSGCAIEMLHNKFRFNQPNTGIAFTIPVDGIKY